MSKLNKKYDTIKTIVQNKRAKNEYFISKAIEAGLSLHGWEVKSVRAGLVQISNSYVIFKDGEAYLLGAVFQPLIATSLHLIQDPKRNRKLLLSKRELNSLFGHVNRKVYTIIPLSLYWKNVWIKIQIGVAKGKKNYDKRMSIKDREWKIDKARAMQYK